MNFRCVAGALSHPQKQLKDLKESEGSVAKIAPGSADGKQLVRRQMVTLMLAHFRPITRSTRKFYKIMKGKKFALERRKQLADITKEMLDENPDEIVLKPSRSLSFLHT